MGPRVGLPPDIIKSDGGDGERKEKCLDFATLENVPRNGNRMQQIVNYLNAPVRHEGFSKDMHERVDHKFVLVL